MHWVWNRSQSKGNPRIALLAVADRVRTPACEVRVSYTEFMRALNVGSRAVVRGAIKAATDSGDLEVVEPGKGTRAALYRLPKAVGYARGDVPSGLESGPLDSARPARSGTESGPQGSASSTESGPLANDHDHASGPDSDPERSGFRPSSGPDSDPHYQSQKTRSEGASERPALPVDTIPEFARPLVDACTLSDIHVRWNFNTTEWFELAALIKRSGVSMLATYARKQYAARDITYARYFMPGWRDLPPIPRPDAERPPLRAISGGYQPRPTPSDSDYQTQGGF